MPSADDPAQAARDLQVDSVLAGTYQHVGTVMRVSVQLIDHGAARWASRYDLQGRDLLRFEDDICKREFRASAWNFPEPSKPRCRLHPRNPKKLTLSGEARAFWADYFMESNVDTTHNAARMAKRLSQGTQLCRCRILCLHRFILWKRPISWKMAHVTSPVPNNSP